jgi:hypothetical protein
LLEVLQRHVPSCMRYGYEVAPRGRIAADVLEAFDAAN